MEEKELKQIEAMMTRVVGVFAEDVQHKFEILAEGQQMIIERIDRLEHRVEAVEAVVNQQSGQIKGLAVDLSAHRRDTEAHQKGWRVSEGE